jgi:hypothetical protein
MINYYNKLKKTLDDYLKFIKKMSQDIARLIKSNYKSFKFLLPILRHIYNNPSLILGSISIISILFASLVINIIFIFLLFDSIILSLLILHTINIKNYSRKLSKNVLSLFVLYFNPIGALITLFIVSILYSNYSKFTSKLIIKIFESMIMFLFTFLPFLSYLYPKSKFIKNDKAIDSTNQVSQTETNTNTLDNLSSST